MYWYPTHSCQYVSTGPYAMSLASHASNAERYWTSIWCDYFLKNGVFQGEKQHTIHYISAATIAATSASGHHVSSTLDALCWQLAYLITLNPYLVQGTIIIVPFYKWGKLKFKEVKQMAQKCPNWCLNPDPPDTIAHDLFISQWNTSWIKYWAENECYECSGQKKGHQLQTNSIGEGFVKSWNSDGLEG